MKILKIISEGCLKPFAFRASLFLVTHKVHSKTETKIQLSLRRCPNRGCRFAKNWGKFASGQLHPSSFRMTLRPNFAMTQVKKHVQGVLDIPTEGAPAIGFTLQDSYGNISYGIRSYESNVSQRNFSIGFQSYTNPLRIL